MKTVNKYVTEFFWDAGRTYDLLDTTTGAQLYSDSFALKSDPSVKFALFMDGSEYCADHLKKGVVAKSIDANKPVRVKIQLWIFDPDEEKLYEHVSENFTFDSKNRKCEFGTAYGETGFLTDVYNKKWGITFGCKLTHLNPVPYPRLQKFNGYLVRKIQDAHEKETGLNFDTIIVAGGKEFKVLRAVLILHSSVFRQMFTGNFKEALTGRVEVNGTSAAAMEAFIKWMYTGELTNMDIIEELFMIGDKYMVTDLKYLCTNLISGTLTEENATRRLVLAAKYNVKSLEQEISKFVHEQGPEFMHKTYQSKAWFEYMKLQHRDGN